MSRPQAPAQTPKPFTSLRLPRRQVWSLLCPLLLSASSSLASVGQVSAQGRQPQTAAQLEAARDSYEQILVTTPTDAAAQAGMASTSERLALDQRGGGNLDDALATLLRAVKVEPSNKRILLDLGILEDEMQLYIDAADTLTRLEALPPVEPNAFYALARVDLNLGRLSGAEEQMQTYLHFAPTDASAHFGLGKIYAQGLHFEKAEAEFLECVRLQPAQTEAYYELGQVYVNESRFEEAIPLFQLTLARDPKHGGAMTGLGSAYLKLRKYAEAETWLVKATQAAPDYQPAHYYLGLTFARLGDHARSKQELDLATSLAAQDNKRAASRLRLNSGGLP